MVMFDRWHAARVLVIEFPETAIELLAGRNTEERDPDDVVKFIQKACKARNRDFGTVMSLEEHPMTSQQPVINSSVNQHHRHASRIGNPSSPLSPPYSSQASSPVLTSPSNKPRSSSGSSEVVFAIIYQDPPRKPLTAKHTPKCYHLISQDIAKRLELEPKPLSSPQQIQHNDAYLIVSQYVELTWMRVNAKKSHESLFFLVSVLETDLVFGDYNPEDLLTQLHNGLYPCLFFCPMEEEDANYL